MTFAEFFVALEGYAKANSDDESKDEKINEAEYLRVLSEEQMAGRA
jgi:hypothetical protein